jgi:steroid delta-isomerase-like uncharacterized protein
MHHQEGPALARRAVEEVYGRGNYDVVDEIFAEDYLDRSPGNPPGLPPGREGQKQLVRMFRTAFPDLTARVEDIIDAGDKVVVRWMGEGTHQGEFLGIPPTGKAISAGGVSIYRIANGKIAEEWTLGDLATVLQQIGVIPAPAEMAGATT